MLDLAIFLPLITGLLLLAVPSGHDRLVRRLALAGALATALAVAVLWIGYVPGGPALQQRTTLAWIPAIGAGYDVAVTGVSLPLMSLTALLMLVVGIYLLDNTDRAKGHAFLLMLLATGLMGVFASQDLLLFYLFFELALVPMYFIIGVWGGERRRYAALKFFLYTRAGSLAMLLGFLALYLGMAPHTFSLPAIVAARPLDGRPEGVFVLFALLVGFGVKLPTVPLHNWLPDAHVEAPTEGSVVLAGLQLKMGAYGLIAVLLTTLPRTVARWGWLLIALALVSFLYSALAALAQRDLKRLIAYTSINHMAYVMLAVAVAAMLGGDLGRLAVDGATLQMVSHGLLTGALFLMAGVLHDRTETRDLDRLGGLFKTAPLFAVLFGAAAFGSFGLPGLSGFVSEFPVIAGAVGLSLWVAAVVALALVLMTAVYLKAVAAVLTGEPEAGSTATGLAARELWAVAPLIALSVAIGVLPGLLLSVIDPAVGLLVRVLPHG